MSARACCRLAGSRRRPEPLRTRSGRLRLPAKLVCITLLFAAPLRADEIKGTFLRLHSDRDALTLKIGDAEQTFALTSRTIILGLNKVPLKDGLRSSLFKHPGVFVRVTTERQDGRQAVRELAILRRTASPFRVER